MFLIVWQAYDAQLSLLVCTSVCDVIRVFPDVTAKEGCKKNKYISQRWGEGGGGPVQDILKFMCHIIA